MTKYYLNINEENKIVLSGGNLESPTTDLEKINRFMSNIAKYAENKELLEENETTIKYLIDTVEISVNKKVLEQFNSYLAAYRILNILPKTVSEVSKKASLNTDEKEMIEIITTDLKRALNNGNLKKIKELTAILKKKNHQLVSDYNIKISVNREKSINGNVIKIGAVVLGIGIFVFAIYNSINASNNISKEDLITPIPIITPVLETPNIGYVEATPNVTPNVIIDNPASLPSDLEPYYNGNTSYNPYEYVEPTAAPYDPNTNQNVPEASEVTPAPSTPQVEEVTPTPYIPKVIDGGVSYVNIPGLQDASWTDKLAFVKKNYGSTFEKYAKITGNSSAIMMALATQEKGYHEPIRDPYGDVGICQINPDIWLKKDSQGNYYVSEDYYDFSENKWKNFLFDESIYNEEENIFASNIIFHNCLNEFKGNIVAALFAYNWGPTATKEKLMQISSEYGMDYDEFLTNTPDYRWIDAFNEEVKGENGTTMVVNYALLVLRYLPQNTPISCNINGDDGNIYAKVYSVASALTINNEGFVFN